jgi:hypothetical protein
MIADTLVLVVPDKAKPFERRGRKVTGLNYKIAELPKEKSLVSSVFYLTEFVVYSC